MREFGSILMGNGGIVCHLDIIHMGGKIFIIAGITSMLRGLCKQDG